MSGGLGVAVVGLGVGEQHARAYAGLAGCEPLVLHDLDGARAAALARELGAETAATYGQILADPRIGAVSIASFDDAHFEQVVAALEVGKHLFVEKPLCRSVAEARVVKAAWERAGGRSRVESNLVLRAAPLFRWLREEREAGRLGQVYAFDGDYLYGRLAKITDGWRKDVPDYSVLLGGGVHLVDLMLWITGERPSAVSAVGNRIVTAGTAFRYPDYAAAAFTFPSGLIGRITANFGCVHRHQHVVRVFGTEATVTVDDAGPRIHRERDGGAPAAPLVRAALPASKGDLIPRFVAAVLAGEPVRDPVQHELDVVSACSAAERALAEGGTIAVEYA